MTGESKIRPHIVGLKVLAGRVVLRLVVVSLLELATTGSISSENTDRLKGWLRDGS